MNPNTHQSLRMLYVACARIPDEKAPAYQILKMCEAFTEQGLTVTLLYQNRKNRAIEQRVGNVFDYYQIQSPFVMQKLFCLDLVALGKIHPRIQFYLVVISYLYAVFCYILAHRKTIDVIYCRDKFSFILLAIMKSFIKYPVFYEVHAFPTSLLKLHVACAKKINGLIVLTEQLRKKFIACGINAAKLHVAHDGVDIKQFNPVQQSSKKIRELLDIPEDAILVGYVGRFTTMEREKGITELIEAMHYCAGYTSALYMVFVGGPMNQVPTYYNIIDRLRLKHDRFIFCDLVPPSEVPAYLAAFDILAMPFPREPHYEFNMSPLKMFEYMAAQKPIIATALPSIMEVLKDRENAILVAPNNPESLADGIKQILHNTLLAQSISLKARQDVMHYSWAQRAEKIKAFITLNINRQQEKTA